MPGRFCFTPPALMGFTLRSHAFDRYSRRFRPNRPTYCFSCRCFPVPKHRAGPTGRSFWVLTLPRVPSDQTVVLAPPSSDGSLGFFPSRAFHKGLDQDFARSPLTCFAERTTSDSIDRHPRVSINLCLTSPLNQSCLWLGGRATLIGLLHRLHP